MGNQKSNIAKMIFTLAFLSSALMGLTAGLPYYPTGNSYRARTERMMKPTPTQTIAELAIATPQLSTLLAAVQAADLVETLSGEGPFTVFAPTNEAFAEIPKDTLDALLADKDALTADANSDNCRTRDRHAPIVHLVSRCASCRPGRNALRRRTFHCVRSDQRGLC